MAKGLKLTTDEFINRATEVHNGFYDYSKTIYTAWYEDVCARKSAEAKNGFHENHGRKLWQS